MTPEEETLRKIKDEVAEKAGFVDYKNMVSTMGGGASDIFVNLLAKAMFKAGQESMKEHISAQTDIIENLVSGVRIVNLDEAIQYYKSITRTT